MYVKIVRAEDNYVLNIRHTDELLEDGTFADEKECLAAENELRTNGRYWINADTYLKRH